MSLQLTKTFPPEVYSGALSSWTWLDLSGRTPALASIFGDVIFASAEGFWFLDLTAGSFELVWPDSQAMLADLLSTQGQDRYLLAGLAVAAYAGGLELAADEVYSFTLPHVMGGQLEVDNVEALDFEVAVRLAGQIHRQFHVVRRGRHAREIALPTYPSGTSTPSI